MQVWASFEHSKMYESFAGLENNTRLKSKISVLIFLEGVFYSQVNGHIDEELSLFPRKFVQHSVNEPLFQIHEFFLLTPL
jgi:hypothetical protein